MSEDESLVMVASGAVALLLWAIWYWRTLRVGQPARPGFGRTLLLSAPVLAIGVLYAVLREAAASDVREDPRYLVMYTVLGAAWLMMGAWWLPVAGISPRDDVLERGNDAAAVAIASALLAVTLCYAGGNVGDGPGWWVVVFSAGLATAALFAAWMLLETAASVSEAVTVDRDVASGVRLAAFLVASGAIFGRAAAGDWVSAPDTMRDFAIVGAPAAVLLVLAVVVERAARPSAERPAPSIATYGVMPAVIYLGAAALHLARLGPAV